MKKISIPALVLTALVCCALVPAQLKADEQPEGATPTEVEVIEMQASEGPADTDLVSEEQDIEVIAEGEELPADEARKVPEDPVADTDELIACLDALVSDGLPSPSQAKHLALGETVTLTITSANMADYAYYSDDNIRVSYEFSAPSDGFARITYSCTSASGPLQLTRLFIGDQVDELGKPVQTVAGATGSFEQRVGLAKGTHSLDILGIGSLSATGASTITFKVEFTADNYWEHETASYTPIELDTYYQGTFIEEPWYGYDYDYDFYRLDVDKPVRVRITYGKDSEYGSQEDIDHCWHLFLVNEEVYAAMDYYDYGGLEAEALIDNQTGYGIHWPSSLFENLSTSDIALNVGTYYVVASKRHLAGDLMVECPYHFQLEKCGFPDVPSSHWAKKVIDRAVTLGFFSGYSNGNFGPEDKVTRGQVAVILWNMTGKPPAGSGVKSFPDVNNPSAYYYSAVRWASSVGVVNGFSDGTFGPDQNVTREQLAVMLANYAQKVKGKAVSGSEGDYASMSDTSDVSAYAKKALGWCFKNGILSGNKGRILPQGNATRAETAKMVVKLYDLVMAS